MIKFLQNEKLIEKVEWYDKIFRKWGWEVEFQPIIDSKVSYLGK